MRNAQTDTCTITVEKTPLSIGLHAARANFVPGVIIQSAMLLIVLAYYFIPATRGVFETLAEAKGRYGYGFSMAAAVVAGAILPMLLTICIFQQGKVRRENLRELLFLTVFWGLDAVVVDALYRLQGVMFGPQVDLPTVVTKVAFDQFVYNPLLAAPLGIGCYEWKNQRYALAGMSRVWTWTFYKHKVFPALLATWVVWIPVCGAIYSLPPLLQIPLFALALTFWVMMLAYITASRKDAAASVKPVELAAVASE